MNFLPLLSAFGLFLALFGLLLAFLSGTKEPPAAAASLFIAGTLMLCPAAVYLLYVPLNSFFEWVAQ